MTASPPQQKPPRDRTSFSAALVIALLSAGIAGGGAFLLLGRAPPPPLEKLAAAPVGCILDPPARIGGAISLINQAGARVSEASFAGAPALVYFGFTRCPDICPTTLTLIAQTLPLLGPAGAQLQTVLITVDPDRDTPDTLDSYLSTEGFPPRLSGLTGTQDEIAAAARAFAVNYQRAEQGHDYTMNHTSFVYLMDEAWRPRAMMSTIGRSPEELAACLRDGLATAPAAQNR